MPLILQKQTMVVDKVHDDEQPSEQGQKRESRWRVQLAIKFSNVKKILTRNNWKWLVGKTGQGHPIQSNDTRLCFSVGFSFVIISFFGFYRFRLHWNKVSLLLRMGCCLFNDRYRASSTLCPGNWCQSLRWKRYLIMRSLGAIYVHCISSSLLGETWTLTKDTR